IPIMPVKKVNLEVHSPITKLPPELFAEFCAYLSPNDLFILSKVCRKFYSYLSAPNSFTTQQIWKISRLKFMTCDWMPPPNGMSEKCYVELLITERGCQICKIKKQCKIYWEFGVRCCSGCFIKKTVMIEAYTAWFKSILNYPLELIKIMPFINEY
ncbi:8272_t:CDS:2, partial [Funneliformis mosseae]